MSNDELYGFFEKLRLENNWKCKDDYYKISQKIIQGKGLDIIFSENLIILLSSLYYIYSLI